MQTRERSMPVGIEDFKDLVTGEYYFIGKTRFIKELIDTKILSPVPGASARCLWG